MGFVRNAWYAAAWDYEIGEQLLGRSFLGEPVVLFRKSDGSAAAIDGICPHRFAPLARGQRIGDNVQCAYHGLEFDGSGRCVKNPQSGGRIVDALNVRSYPVHEQDTLLWIWMGDPALAEASKIPDFGHLKDPARRHLKGVSFVNCNYRLLVDNLMDLGHFNFLHGGMAKLDKGFDDVKREVRQEGDTVFNNLLFPGCKPTILFQSGFPDPNVTVDQFNDIRWDPVGIMRNFVGVTPTGEAKENGVNHYGTHIVTPETETSCHYFYGSSRNFSQADPEAEKIWRLWQQRALNEEDKPMLEAIQTLLPYVEQTGRAAAMLSSDAAAVRVARVIDRLTAADQPRSALNKVAVVAAS